jgi:peptide/nickel transport system substrate-binding protein
VVHGRNQRKEELRSLAGRASTRYSSSQTFQRRTAIRLRCGVVVFALALFSCARSDRTFSPDIETLTIGVPEAVAGVNLGVQNLASNLSVESLIQLSPDGRPLPKLAETWFWDNDGLTLRVNLRNGVTFHDGTPLTGQLAADILRQAVTSQSNRMAYAAFGDVREVRATGELQLSFDLLRHSAFLPESLEVPLEMGKSGVGTGAYKVVTRDADQLVLERNDRYYLGRPNIGRVVIRPFVALRTAWSSLLRGDVNMVTDVPPDAVEFVKSDQVEVLTFERRYQVLVAFNSQRPPFNSPLVRKALNLAIDRGALIKTVLKGYASPATGPLWPQHWAYDRSLPSFGFDPALSISMLENGGFRRHDNPAGPRSRFRFTCLIPANFSTIERIALDVQKELYDVGVDMQFEVVRAEDLDARIRTGRFDALLFEMISGPTLSRPYMFWGSTKSFHGLNVFGYENPEVQRLFDVLRTTTNEGAIRSATRDLQRVLLDDPPGLFLAWSQRSRAVRHDFEVVQDAQRDPVDPIYTIWRWTAGPRDVLTASQ